MSPLYLSCGLCGRQQADGMLSRAAWGQVDPGDGSVLRACPTCQGEYADWAERLEHGATQADPHG